MIFHKTLFTSDEGRCQLFKPITIDGEEHYISLVYDTPEVTAYQRQDFETHCKTAEPKKSQELIDNFNLAYFGKLKENAE